MKIGLMCYCHNIDEPGGNSVRAKAVKDIIAKNHDVTLVSLGSNRGHSSRKFILLKSRWKIFWNVWLIYIILKQRFDCVYFSNDWRGFFTCYLFSKVIPLAKTTLIFEAHSIVSETVWYLSGKSLKYRLSRIVEKFVISHSDYIITLSQNSYEYYNRWNKRNKLIPVFIDEDLFKTNEEYHKYKRNINRVSRLIGLIGPFGIGANKGFIEFVTNHEKEFDPRIRFIAIGRCENMPSIKSMNYTGFIKLKQEYVNQIAQLDAVLIPSMIATTGPLNKILEPMSCSLPVFTTPAGMVGLYYLTPGKDIFVFEANDLPGKINEMIFKDELLNRIGSNARKSVETNYSMKKNGDKILNLLNKISKTIG